MEGDLRLNPVARLALAGFTALTVAGCLQRGPTYDEPIVGPQATLTYTSNRLGEGFMGRAVGVSGLYLFAKPSFCSQQRRPLGDIRQVDYEQPESRVTLPANQPLAVELFWQGAEDRKCLIDDLAFLADPGAEYRLINDVDLEAGRCRITVEKRQEDGSFRRLGRPPSLEEACRAERGRGN